MLCDVRDHAALDSSHKSRVQIDPVRLAALNWIVTYRFGNDYLGLNEDQLLFSELSYESEKRGAARKEVGELARSIIEGLKLEQYDRIKRIPLNDFIELLGRIHALGSYQLPPTIQQASFQKPLGAFYTPQSLADYIVRLTLGPRLREHVRYVRKKGISAFRSLASLLTVDPACGSGVFLVSALRAMKQALHDATQVLERIGISKDEIDDSLTDGSPRIYGVDLDAGALEVADVSLRIVESSGSPTFGSSHIGSTLKRGNSLISLNGISDISNHRCFFRNPDGRTPFEWRNAFKEVFCPEQGGFDFVVMNPPYERLKPNLAEFMREQLLSGENEIHASRFEEYKADIRESSRYFRESKEFHLATSYSLNTYQLFIERALQIIKTNGNIGFIVPSNILSDISTARLRQELLLRNVVNVIDEFPEASRLFTGVTQSVSIISLTKGGRTGIFEIGLNRTGVNDASRRGRHKVNLWRILQTMGQSLVIPRVDALGLAYLEIMHRQPSLSSLGWILARRGELDLTLNKTYISSDESDARLIRGSHIRRFHLTEAVRAPEFVDLESFRRTLNASERSEHVSMKRIICQQISNMGQRWRLKFAPVEPLTILSNSCNYLVDMHPDSSRYLDFLLGILNSELLNWRFQIASSNNHVSIRELQSLPISQPSSGQSKLEQTVVREVQKLKAGTRDFSAPLDASTFALYGLGVKEANGILTLRKTPENQSDEILDELSKMEGESLSG